MPDGAHDSPPAAAPAEAPKPARWRRRALALAFLAAALFGVFAVFPRAPAMPAALALARGKVSAEFADEAACQACHPAICAAHAASSMGRDWSAWSAGPIVEDRAPGRKKAVKSGDVFYQVEIVEGKQFQREFRVLTDGTEKTVAINPADGKVMNVTLAENDQQGDEQDGENGSDGEQDGENGSDGEQDGENANN